MLFRSAGSGKYQPHMGGNANLGFYGPKINLGVGCFFLTLPQHAGVRFRGFSNPTGSVAVKLRGGRV